MQARGAQPFTRGTHRARLGTLVRLAPAEELERIMSRVLEVWSGDPMPSVSGEEARTRLGEKDGRACLAVEPMSCPRDAFNSGLDLIWLLLGAEHKMMWKISAI